MDNNLFDRTNYVIDRRYIAGRITEYDIKSANISVLKQYNAIDDATYMYLSSISKREREIHIGKLIKSDRQYQDIISKGIKEAKNKLATSNNIREDEVVRIANDAIYVNRSYDLQNTTFGYITFKKKAIYASMLKLLNIIIFSSYIDGNIDIDVKGLGHNAEYHQDYMLNMIANAIYILDRVGTKEAIEYVKDFYINYTNLNLDKEYYRELNSTSLFRLKYTDYLMPDIKDKNDIDINYNLYIIRELMSILFEVAKQN